MIYLHLIITRGFDIWNLLLDRHVTLNTAQCIIYKIHPNKYYQFQ